MRRRSALIACLLLATVLVARAQQKTPIADLKTTPESTGYKSTSTYDDVVKFMKAVDAASPFIYYTTYGTTFEKREMPMAVVGTGLKDASAAAVKASGKLRVHIQANVHAGEVEGKESCLVLLREFALGQHKDWLQSMVFLITPIYNADGNEKFALNNRQRQNGPINGMGTRANAQDLNINRDYMKLDTPEARAFVKLWNDYDPHVGFDLHTSDGSYHGYYLTYSPPLNPDTDPGIMKIMTDEWFPAVTKEIKAKHGWDTFYYGNAGTPGGRGGGGRGRGGREGAPAGAPPTPPAGAPAGAPGTPPAGAPAGAPTGAPGAAPGGFGRGGPACQNVAPPEGVTRAWGTFEHVPRFHNNYVGLRNRFGLLSEAYAYATFEDRIKATNGFVEAALNFANQNVAKIKKAIADADKAKIDGVVLATTARMKRGGMVDILMGKVEPEKNPNNNADMCRRKDVVKTEPMIDMMWFEPATTETAARGYYLPENLTKAVDLLKAHGVQVQPVRGSLAEAVEGFSISSNTVAPTAFEGHKIRKLEGKWGVMVDHTITSGWVVYTNQPLGRLAFYLLEPTSDDGLVAWNVLDDQLKDEGAKLYPILRIVR